MASDATLSAVGRNRKRLEINRRNWHQTNPLPMCEYPASSWGPKEADEFLRVDGRE